MSALQAQSVLRGHRCSLDSTGELLHTNAPFLARTEASQATDQDKGDENWEEEMVW